MSYFRNTHKRHSLVYLIAFGMLIRTFVATGYMLDAEGENGNLVSVTVCHGPNNANKSPEPNQPNNTENNEAQTNCNLWVSSGTSLDIQQFTFNYQNNSLNEELIFYKFIFNTSINRLTQFARAPPTLV